MKFKTVLVVLAVGLVAVAAKPKKSVGACLRVINTDSQPQRFQVTVLFHQTPWASKGNYFSDNAIPAGGATPWLAIGTLTKHAPFTTLISAKGGSAKMRVEYAPAEDGPVTRAIEFEGKELVVECEDLTLKDAGKIRTDEEIGRATLAAVQAMQFKGKVPERFPAGDARGHDFELAAARLLGFNAIGGPPAGWTRERFDRLGFRYIYTFTHLLTAARQDHGYDRAINLEEMQKLAGRFAKVGLLDRVYRVSVFDEPGFKMSAKLEEKFPDFSKDTNAWYQMISRAGLTRADFEPPATAADRATNPLGVYRTMLLYQAIYPTRFGNARDAIRDAFGTNVLVTANVHADHWFKTTLTDIEPWLVYSKLKALDVPQACDYGVGWPQNEEFLIDTMRCALRPRDEPVDAYLAAQAHYAVRSPASLKLRAFSAIGAGARSLSFYEWGPRYLATENWYDTDRDRLRVIGEVCHAVGWAEDILLDGRPRQSKVAIMFSRASDLWDSLDGEKDAMIERRQLFHLLRGLHQQPDALNDDFLPLDLDSYQVIFLAQRCISKTVTDRLLAWVEHGGTLIASGKCCEFDELNRPSDYFARQLRGKCVFAEKRLGQRYHTGAEMENDVLVGMQVSVRDELAPRLPAPECATDNPLIGARLIESPRGCAIVIVNSTGKPSVPLVHVTVRMTGSDKAESLEQGTIKFKTSGDVVEFDVPVGLTDIIRLQRR